MPQVGTTKHLEPKTTWALEHTTRNHLVLPVGYLGIKESGKHTMFNTLGTCITTRTYVSVMDTRLNNAYQGMQIK